MRGLHGKEERKWAWKIEEYRGKYKGGLREKAEGKSKQYLQYLQAILRDRQKEREQEREKDLERSMWEQTE